MIFKSEAYIANEVLAKKVQNYEKTIAVLTDERPGFNMEAAHELICELMDMGYYVHEVSTEELCRKEITTLGFLLVLPHSESVPAVCARPIEEYWKQGGRLLILGGPLFAHLIEKEDERFVNVPLGDQVLDAAISGKMHPIVMEGFTPSYKVYEVDGVTKFMTERDQEIVHNTIEVNESECVICPRTGMHGLGYRREQKTRVIPLVQAMGEGGRADGRRGAVAYIVFSDVRMKRLGVDGNYFGYVLPTNYGGCAAGIGFKRQDIFRIKGMRDMIADIVRFLQEGLYLYDGGAEYLTSKPGDTLRVGATILNQNCKFKDAEVVITVTGKEGEVYRKELDVYANPMHYTHADCSFTVPAYDDYTVNTVLKQDGRIIDSITAPLTVYESKKAEYDDFVRLKDNEFWCKGKKWYAYGINYWPLYYPALEHADYWTGWFDKTNYDPMEVERDLDMIRNQMGLNCVFTRIDGNVFERGLDCVKDFMMRCERHDIKVSLSWCNITSPLHYQPKAFRKFMELCELKDNATLFTHDLSWESGMKFYDTHFMNTWDADWEKWISEHYGSVENAEADWKVSADRDAAGHIVAPPMNEFNNDGAWRVKIAAYRRFIDDYASRFWNDTVSDIRSLDKNHLIGYRMGNFHNNTAALTGMNKHVDYGSPEGYGVSNDDNGMYGAMAVSVAMSFVTSGKPVLWSEYGNSLTDVRWRKLVWDNEHSRPYEWKEKEQTAYLKRMYYVFEHTNVAGTAPWWFPGGFRRVEMSDFGFCGPDGLLRPGAKSYVELGKSFLTPRSVPQATKWLTIDPDVSAIGWRLYLRGLPKPGDDTKPIDGNGQRLLGEVRGIIPQAIAEAEKTGDILGLRTPGTGTTSENMPLLAVGNTPLNGKNPAKYLNAEFNYIEYFDGEKWHKVGKNATIPFVGDAIDLRVSIGNTQEATWLKPGSCKSGAVYLICSSDEKDERIAIKEDVKYLADTVVHCQITQKGSFSLRMFAQDRGSFGETWHLEIV